MKNQSRTRDSRQGNALFEFARLAVPNFDGSIFTAADQLVVDRRVVERVNERVVAIQLGKLVA